MINGIIIIIGMKRGESQDDFLAGSFSSVDSDGKDMEEVIVESLDSARRRRCCSVVEMLGCYL